jgi:hypothetical protein
MASKIFLNLSVKDLQKTNAFFTALGFRFNPHFSDDKATCMLVNDEAFVMLLQENYFRGFTPSSKVVANAHQVTEVLIAISQESRADVDAMLQKAIAAGGTEAREAQDHDFMYSRAINDLDGHIWEIFWMDPNAVPPTE